ncbi:MAG: hypothetical protein Q7P63_11300 [Verrucomicrobiota bacterium JB022]|nr:hypothetical protein [Verrucomicrobiota bacterium JB022]
MIEFYRHKFVGGDWYRDTLGFRLSGKKLMKIAREVFDATEAEVEKLAASPDADSVDRTQQG